MNDKITKLLTDLAAKFGTTVVHLWGVLVRQAWIDASQDVLLAAFCLVVTVIWFRIVRKHTRRVEINGYEASDWEEGAIPAWGLFAISLAITVAACAQAEQSVLTALFNPEYYALNKILSRN